MSYCRYRNTLLDLQDCFYSMHNDIQDIEYSRSSGERADISPEEERAMDDLIKLCGNIYEQFGMI